MTPTAPAPTYHTPSSYRSPPTGHRSGELCPPPLPSQHALDLPARPQPAFGQLSRRRSASLRALDDPFVGSSTMRQPPVTRSPFHRSMRRYSPEGPLVTASRSGAESLGFEGNDDDTASQYSRSAGARESSVADMSDGASVRMGLGRRPIGSTMTSRGVMERYDETEAAPTILRQNANMMAREGHSTAAGFGDSSSANVIYTPQTSRLSRSGHSLYSSNPYDLSDIPLEDLARHRYDLREAGLLHTPHTPPPAQRPVLSGDDLRQWLDNRASAIRELASAVSDDAEVIPATPLPPPPQPLTARLPRRSRPGVVIFWVSLALCLLFPPTGLIIGYGYGDWIAWFCTGGRSVGFAPRHMRWARWVGFGLTAVYIVLLVFIVVYRGGL